MQIHGRFIQSQQAKKMSYMFYSSTCTQIYWKTTAKILTKQIINQQIYTKQLHRKCAFPTKRSVNAYFWKVWEKIIWQKLKFVKKYLKTKQLKWAESN